MAILAFEPSPDGSYKPVTVLEGADIVAQSEDGPSRPATDRQHNA
jgi:hypothetical protein